MAPVRTIVGQDGHLIEVRIGGGDLLDGRYGSIADAATRHLALYYIAYACLSINESN
jgi:hypothetical protein